LGEPIKERKIPHYEIKDRVSDVMFVLYDKKGYKQMEVIWDGNALWIERHGMGAVKVNFKGDVWHGPID